LIDDRHLRFVGRAREVVSTAEKTAKKRPKIGLVLSGGGTRGFAHIGGKLYFGNWYEAGSLSETFTHCIVISRFRKIADVFI
jgi:hypothetical protein